MEALLPAGLVMMPCITVRWTCGVDSSVAQPVMEKRPTRPSDNAVALVIFCQDRKVAEQNIVEAAIQEDLFVCIRALTK